MPLSLLAFLFLVAYYIFYSSGLYSEISASSTSTPQPISTTSKPQGGLYSASKYVIEISNEPQYNQLLNGSKSVIAVYYASWCGHCRAFAPQFMQTSEIVTKTLSQLRKYDPSARNITFIAIDCVQHRGICRSNKVSFYPMVIAHYLFMAGCKDRECTRLQGAKSDVLKYLSSTIFTHGELDEKFLYDSSEGDSNVLATLYMNNDTLSYHLTPSTLTPPRTSQSLASSAYLLNDMMASYAYFLYNDLPTNMDTQQAALVYVLNHLLIHTLPRPGSSGGGYNNQHIQAYHLLLTKVNEVLYKYSAHAQFPSSKITNALLEPPLISNLPPLASVPTSHLRQHTRGLAHAQQQLSPMKWYVCGVPVAMKQSRAASPHADPTRGYTCGLWMFFHYLTYHAPGHSYAFQGVDVHRGLYGRYFAHLNNLTMPSSARSLVGASAGADKTAHHNATHIPLNYTVSPDLVQGFVYLYVGRFFRCADCRSHFMHYHSLNLFKPTPMTSISAQDVQLWLLLLHNFINLRILYENVYVLKNRYVHSVSRYNVDTVRSDLGKHDSTMTNANNTSEVISGQVLCQRIVNLADASLWPSYAQCPQCYVAELASFKDSLCLKADGGNVDGLNGYEAVAYEYVNTVFVVGDFVKYVETLYKL